MTEEEKKQQDGWNKEFSVRMLFPKEIPVHETETKKKDQGWHDKQLVVAEKEWNDGWSNQFAERVFPKELPVPNAETYYLLVGKITNMDGKNSNKWQALLLSTDMDEIKTDVSIMEDVTTEMKLFKVELPL